jgi:hypothetical protein
MKKEISIIKKDEAYTYDELDFLEERLLPHVAHDAQKISAAEVLHSLKASLENQKTSAAVFFMPKNTFNIFSLIQGDNSICKISNENIESLCKAFNLADNLASKPIFSHLKKKLQVLNEYLQQGNEVTPTVIAADNFSLMEI